MPTALFSVTDKTGLVPLVRVLQSRGFDILSTGGTAALLKAESVQVTQIAEFTESPEMLGGRVKTLHPRVFGSILGRPDEDQKELARHNLELISVVVVNLYEFDKTVANATVSEVEATESIDIGGVALVRAAAKNSEHVLVVVDPSDYDEVQSRVCNDRVDREFRRRMAAKAFRHTAAYDAGIAKYLSGDDPYPEKLTLSYTLESTLRYGENPHQSAAYYRNVASQAAFSQLHGKELSYNNIADVDTASMCVHEFENPCCAIVKHANPCGLAVGNSAFDAYERAFQCDPTSAFGGVIAFNVPLRSEEVSAILQRQFVEVLAAPGFEDDAANAARIKKNVRLLDIASYIQGSAALGVRTTSSGVLVQGQDQSSEDTSNWEVATPREPTEREWRDLVFAWRVVQHVKSNAIVFARDVATIGIGAGQMNRLLSVRIAALRMQEEGLNKDPSVMASDAFFPFRDSIDVAAEAGITAVIQPGGSIRDGEILEACVDREIAMVTTGERHFKH